MNQMYESGQSFRVETTQLPRGSSDSADSILADLVTAEVSVEVSG